jgi:hypothetical protein
MKKVFLIVVLGAAVLLALFYFLTQQSDMQAPIETPVVEQEQEQTPPPSAQGKLNITVVCESALAYMTFTDGASADAFVADCIEGKHPEVIERYKADMNLGDGATI